MIATSAYSAVSVKVLPFENRQQIENISWLSDGLQFVLEEKLYAIAPEISVIRDETEYSLLNLTLDYIVDGEFVVVDGSLGMDVTIYDKNTEIVNRLIFHSVYSQILQKMNEITERIAIEILPNIILNPLVIYSIPTNSWVAFQRYFQGLAEIAGGYYLDGFQSLELAVQTDCHFRAPAIALDYYSSHFPINPGKFMYDINEIQTQIQTETSIPKLLEFLTRDVYEGKITKLDIEPIDGNLHMTKLSFQVEYAIQPKMIKNCISIADSLGFHFTESDNILRIFFTSTETLPDELMQKMENQFFYQNPVFFMRSFDEDILIITDGFSDDNDSERIIYTDQFSPMFGIYHNPWEVTLVVEKIKQTVDYSFIIPLEKVADVREIEVRFGTAGKVSHWITDFISNTPTSLQ